MNNTGKTFGARDIAEGKMVYHQAALGKSFATQADFDKHARQLGQQPMRRIMPSEVELGFFDTSPKLCGKYKQFWIMRLRRLPGRNRLPRGFTSKQQFV